MPKKNYKIQFVDRILDPVHGFIDITQVEKEIIDLPIFKRLQTLKQLSLTNWVFPGAEHTRYMHSLGVMYIVDLMASNLKDTQNKLKFNDEQRQLLRLAGLLHDIGHYPLSHVTEGVYQDNLLKEVDSLEEYNQKIFNKIKNKFINKTPQVPGYMKSRYSQPMHHEFMGAEVIKSDVDIQRIIHKYCPFINIDDITDIIVGDVDNNPNISAMVQLMHSELDADGMDYIMRDATFSGTTYGGFELGLLLRNLVVTEYKGVDIVGIRPKGISLVDQYLISKYFSYTQVIMNRHVSIYNTMAELFTKTLINLDKSNYPHPQTLLKYVQNHCNNEDFLKFTDRAFWSQLDSIVKSDLEKIQPDFIVQVHNKLQHYQEFEVAEDGEFIVTTNKPGSVYNQLINTKLYTHLKNNEANRLFVYLEKSFTNELPEEVFKKYINPVDSNMSSAQYDKFNVPRLQEGIVVIDPSANDLKLLVDDPRSIMSHLYDTKTYILREYKI